MLSRLRRRLTRWALESDPIWRYGFNLSSTLAYRRAPQPQTEEGLRVVTALDEDGVAVTAIDRLLSDTSLYDELLRESEALVRQKRRAGGDGRAYTHETNYLGAEPLFDPDSIFARFAVQDEILSIVNAYFGMYTQLRKYAVFLNEATGGGPTVNQQFHRDGDFHYLLMRLFVYLADVDERSGPFTYYPGTHVKGRVGRTAKLGDVAAMMEPKPIVGPAGTVVFGDTRGFHRGGMCEAGTRFFYNALYTSPAVGADYFKRVEVPTRPRSDAASWALSPPRHFL